MSTKIIPADEIVVGTRFIPAGRRRPVEVLHIEDWHPGRLGLMCTSPHGDTVQFVSRYATVEAVIAERAA